MLDKIIEIISHFWQHLTPFFIVYDYEAALIFRLGKFVRKASRGLNVKIPILDSVIRVRTLKDTIRAVATTSTIDGVMVSCCLYLEYQIVDARDYFFNNGSLLVNLEAITNGILSSAIRTSSYDTSSIEYSLHLRFSEYPWRDRGVVIHSIILEDLYPTHALLINR